MTVFNPIPLERTTSIQLMDRAPDFCAPAYYQGQETEICLSAYIGKWLLIFFYSSDFSFV